MDKVYTKVILDKQELGKQNQSLDTAQEQLSVGTVSRVELSEAIAAYSSALGDCIVAFYDGQRAEAALFALVGQRPDYAEKVVDGMGGKEK